ncbi:MAG: biotin--[acetyl-CoA-carboxylase] ligase [Deferribacterota bacterium]|nr:biotin--[acetyl-CoA-carboxylase] ligase [Deferribacterota bacterium]
MFNNKLYFEHLNTHFLGRKHKVYDKCTSTQDVIREYSNLDGFVVIASTQTKGRGRMGRSWFSSDNENLYFSYVLKNPHLRNLQIINLLVSFSLCELLSEYGNFKIKWPNDIVFNYKKVAGILIESSIVNKSVLYSIIGIGLNINFKYLPKELQDRAISIKSITNANIEKEILLAKYFNIFETYLLTYLNNSITIDLVGKWRELSAYYGKRIKIRLNDDEECFIEKGIDADGALRVTREDGSEKKLYYGEIV